MALTLTPGSETVGSSEHFLASDSTVATYQTSVVISSALIDTTNMAAGDRFRFRRYGKINGSAARVIEECELEGAQPRPVVFEPLLVGEGWEYSIQKIAGTDRSFGWSIRNDDGGVTAANVWDHELDANAPVNARTAKQIANVTVAAVTADASDLAADGGVTIRDTGDTKDRIVGTVVAGVRSLISLDGT